MTHQDLDAMRSDVRREFAELRAEFAGLHAEIGALRGEIGTHVRTIVYANVGLAVGVGGLVLAATQLA